MSTDGNGQGDMNFQSAFTDAANAPPPTPAAPVAAPAAPLPPEGQPAGSVGPEPIQPIPAPEPFTAPAPEPTPLPPAPEAPAPQPAQPTPVQTEVADMASKAGLTVEGKTDQQIFQELAQGYQKMRPYADWAQQLMPHYDQITEYLKQQQEPAQPQPVEPAEPEWTSQKYFQDQWRAPQWDPQFDVAINNNYVRRNPENGIWESAPGFEQMTMAIVPKMNEVLTHSQQQWQDLTRGNPYEKFYDVLQEPMQRAWKTDIEQIVERRLAEQHSAANADRFEQENEAWLYAKDQSTGQRLMTQQGQQFYEAISYFKERGVTDPQALIDCATRTVRGTGQPTQQPAPTQPQGQPPAQPQPPAPSPPATTLQDVSGTQQNTFLQNALDRARHQPNAGGFTQQAPDHPVNVGETELNSMFISSFEASQT